MRSTNGTWGRVTLLVGALWLAVSPQPAFAAEQRTGDSITVAENEVINDDLYAFGNTVTILGTVNGDVMAAGQSVTISGKVSGGVFAAGNSVTITGAVDGSVRAAGGSVTVAGPVGRDLLLAGGTVSVARGTGIKGDVLAAGGVLDIGGDIGRDVMLAGGEITISGTVGRDVQVDGDNLRLGDGARVNGNLSFAGPQAPVVPTSATVQGETFYTQQTPTVAEPLEPTKVMIEAAIGWARGFVGLSVFSLLVVFGLTGISGRATARLRTSWLGALGLGAAVLGATPVIAALALLFGVLVGGWWIGPLLLLLLVPLMFAGYATSALWLGQWMAKRAGRPNLGRFWLVVAGVAVLMLFGAVPVAGGLVGLLAVLLGLGAFIMALVTADSEASTLALQAGSPE